MVVLRCEEQRRLANNVQAIADVKPPQELQATARVQFGNNVTIGLGSVIEIGVAIGSKSQVGALSFVPKYTTLKGGVVCAGIPAVPLE
jgi:acetyltransferase-like isoleucine patch superfamily enzyme